MVNNALCYYTTWSIAFHNTRLTLTTARSSPAYSSATAYIVIVIAVLAEELSALLMVLVASLFCALVLAIEMALSLSLERIKPVSRIAKMTIKESLFTFTPFWSNYIIG